MALIFEFEYKKGGIAPPAQLRDFRMKNYSNPLRWSSDPPWVNIAANRDTKKIHISVNKGYVDHIRAGEYNAFVQLYERVNVINDSGAPEEIFDHLLGFDVSLVLKERVVTTVSPSSFDFYYKIGNVEFPANQILKITSEDNYSITANQPWVKLNLGNGSGNTSVSVGANIQGLVPGTYNGNITVTDSVSSFVRPISLVIDGQSGTEDYIFAAPDKLKFQFTRYGFFPTSKNVSLNASGSFTIESLSTWMDISRNTGNQNTLSFDIGLNNNVNDLGIGIFVSKVILKLGSITEEIEVEVEISQFIEDLFDTDTLYYTDDENVIRLASSSSNTQLTVLINAIHHKLYRFKYAIPFFKGVSKTYIGGEIRKIISKLPEDHLLGEISTKVFASYSAVKVDFDITENKIFSDNILRGVPLKDIRFIKGVTPPDAKLTKLPKKVFLTRKGLLSFSFLEQNSASPKTITIHGAVEKTIPVQLKRNDLYSLLFPMTDIEGLSTGDELTMSVSGIETKVQIKPSGIDHCIVFWENIWGCWDTFECTGQIRSRNKYKYTSDEYRLNRNSLVKEIIEIDTIGVFTIDTGWIYSKEEVLYLESMFDSRNVWLSIDGQLIKVNNKTSSFDPYLTRRFKNKFKLTFEKTMR